MTEVHVATIFQREGNPHYGWGFVKPKWLNLRVATKQHKIGLVVDGQLMKLVPVVADDAAATGTEAEFKFLRFQHLPLNPDCIASFMALFTIELQKKMLKQLLRPLIDQIVSASGEIQGNIIDVIIETVKFEEILRILTINDRRILTDKAFRAMFVLGQRAEAKADEEAAAAAAATGSGMQQEPLTAEQLASASLEQQKNMIGERLYPLIHKEQPDPDLAGKITGMLLEMDTGELLYLLETPDALKSKIQDAIVVLAKAAADAAAAAAPAPAAPAAAAAAPAAAAPAPAAPAAAAAAPAAAAPAAAAAAPAAAPTAAAPTAAAPAAAAPAAAPTAAAPAAAPTAATAAAAPAASKEAGWQEVRSRKHKSNTSITLDERVYNVITRLSAVTRNIRKLCNLNASLGHDDKRQSDIDSLKQEQEALNKRLNGLLCCCKGLPWKKDKCTLQVDFYDRMVNPYCRSCHSTLRAKAKAGGPHQEAAMKALGWWRAPSAD